MPTPSRVSRRPTAHAFQEQCSVSAAYGVQRTTNGLLTRARASPVSTHAVRVLCSAAVAGDSRVAGLEGSASRSALEREALASAPATVNRSACRSLLEREVTASVPATVNRSASRSVLEREVLASAPATASRCSGPQCGGPALHRPRKRTACRLVSPRRASSSRR